LVARSVVGWAVRKDLPVSRIEKLIQRFNSQPADFSWRETVQLLRGLGYQQVRMRTTSGSRRKFIHETASMIIMHEPHPRRELKRYQMIFLRDFLRKEGL